MEILRKHINTAAIFACVSVIVWGCGYNDFKDYDPPLPEQLMPNMDIGDLKAYYDGSPKTVYDDVIIAGYVTANDNSGNFYRSFIIEDHSGAVEIKAGTDELHNLFPIGRYVAVKAQGLRVGGYNGILEIGLHPADGSFYDTDYFGHQAVMDMYVVPGGAYDLRQPSLQTVPGLCEDICGSLVRINNLKFTVEDGGEGNESGETYLETPEGIVTWAVTRNASGGLPQTGYRFFTDPDGNGISVVTSGYANFAGEEIPEGRVSLTGILSFGKTGMGKQMFMLKLRDIKDVHAL